MTSVTKQKCRLDFEAIGTVWTIEFVAPRSQVQSIANLVTQRIAQFDKDYSRFRADSWVTHAGRHIGSHQTPADFAPLYTLYQTMYRLTDGAVTPLIGDAMERAGYDANYSLRPGKLEAIPPLDDVLSFGTNTLHVKQHCVLDFGAAGKGYLVDLVADIIEQQGINHYIIDAGGDIRSRSPTPELIGLENPEHTESIIGAVPLHNTSLCASAGNRRTWGEYHHILDPRTLTSTQAITATWVIAADTMTADGLATCLFFSDSVRLTKEFDFEYVLVRHDGRIQKSANLPIVTPGQAPVARP